MRGCEVAASARPGRAGDEEADSNVRDWEEHSETTAAVIAARTLVNDVEEMERAQPELEAPIAARAVYLDVRNHLIRMWYRDVGSRLGIAAALADVPPEFHSVGVLAFSYLERHGVINAGALPVGRSPVAARVRELQAAPPDHRPWPQRRTRRQRVAVVGAGMAGLAAARQLVSFGLSVTILEAQDRLGGRIQTDSDTFGGVPVDLGAMLITGIAQNPLAVVAAQVGAASVVVQPACPLFDTDGRQVDADADRAAEAEFNAILEEVDARRRNEAASLSTTSLGEVVRATWRRREKMRLMAATRAQGAARSAVARRLVKRERQEVGVGGDPGGVEDADAPRTASYEDEAAADGGGAPGHTGVGRNGPRRSDAGGGGDSDGADTGGSDGAATPDKPPRMTPSSVSSNPLMVRLLRWHQANLEYGCAADVNDVSAVHWDQDDPYGFEGDHVLLRRGFRPILDGMTAGLEQFIQTGKVVTKVAWRGSGVTLTTVNRAAVDAATTTASAGAPALPPPSPATADFDAVVITAPLGVLKAGAITFSPPLPPRKAVAIRRLGCGGLMKVALSFPSVFWAPDDLFGTLHDDDVRRGEFYMWWNMAAVLGAPVLLAIVAEPSVGALEARPDAEVTAAAMAVLRRRFPAAPPPTAVRVTRWSADPYARGAYTHIPVGSSGADYDTLAEPVGRRLFFAGEHTCRTNPTTCASAFLSGLREAARIVDALGWKELITDAHAAELAAELGDRKSVV